MTEPGTAAGPKPAELLGAKHDDPDPTGPLTDYESVPDTAAALPDLPAGVWRHYKGPLYLTLGYAHDANTLGGATTYDDTVIGTHSTEACEWLPLDERIVVVYVGLQLDDAHTGPRLAIRTAEDWHAFVCGDPECDGFGTEATPERGCDHCPHAPVPRFAYVGPEWTGGD